MTREMSSGTDITVRHLLQLSSKPNLPNLFEATFPVRSKGVFPSTNGLPFGHESRDSWKGESKPACDPCFRGSPHFIFTTNLQGK